ncbi:type II toxin-antitoxin system RelB/DinJ family antitoxin [Serratia quinivorans]|uniref:type II toxin-antitoxin system RelB/DinJ family antitoxin n=2 Tax=Serratia TaxID=613 RepID=UPI00217C2DBB|nr:hypothetical protein [Serratia quinivorans]ULG11042.1 hypothetical protein 220p1_00160 [Serratia entomophila]CAI1955860.1 addiction module antitoxin, RelB/DinJ family [Serratia quinivorans]CAI2158967.1 addiction module antitoxin, RelB/DinJ family [Serratia quinivorans]
MSEPTQIGVKVDKALKDEVDVILRGLGIKPTTAIVGLYHYIAQHQALPFIIHTQVNKPSTLQHHLYRDFTLLKRLLQAFYASREHGEPNNDRELACLTNVLHEFITNFRHTEKALVPEAHAFLVDWTKAFNGTKRALYVLEAYLSPENPEGDRLDESGMIKLALALKMLHDAETGTVP